jgi:hypothetical protein
MNLLAFFGLGYKGHTYNLTKTKINIQNHTVMPCTQGPQYIPEQLALIPTMMSSFLGRFWIFCVQAFGFACLAGYCWLFFMGSNLLFLL